MVMNNELFSDEMEFDDMIDDSSADAEENPFDKSMLDDIHMEWTDDGETVLTVDPDAEVVYEDEGEEGSAEPVDTSTAEAQTPAVQPDPWEDRYKNLQSWSDKVQHENQQLKEAVARLEGRVDEIGKPAATSEEDPLEAVDFSSPEAVKDWVKGEVERQTKSTLNEILPNAEQIRIDNEVGVELREAMANLPDFLHYMPAIQRFYGQFPDTPTTFAEAYEIVKAFVGPPGTTTPKEAPPQGTPTGNPQSRPNAPAESAEALKAKAARLRTEEGVAGTDPSSALGRGEVSSIADAMQVAADELYD
jgi:hypothetical protein